MGEVQEAGNKLTMLRGWAALAAAVGAGGICVERGHVRVILAEPATYTSPLHHRCGLLLIVCCAWALAEGAVAWKARRDCLGAVA